jgi:hypothetical protein
LFDEHVEGRREHGHRLWALVMLELWFRNHLDSPGVGANLRQDPGSMAIDL